MVIQADLAFGRFKATLNRPVSASHAHDLFQGYVLPCIDDKGPQIDQPGHTPPHQQPATPVKLDWTRQGPATPVVPAQAFGPIASGDPNPTVFREGDKNVFHYL
jgi:hypothetical protein